MNVFITTLIFIEAVQFAMLYFALYYTSSLGFARPIKHSDIFSTIFKNKISLLFLAPVIGLLSMIVTLFGRDERQ
jgi:hypothetical protein